MLGVSEPGPRTCLRKGGHISVPRFGKGPLFMNFRGKKHPYLYENADFLGTKFTPFLSQTLTFSMLFSVHLHVQTIWKTKITDDFLFQLRILSKPKFREFSLKKDPFFLISRTCEFYLQRPLSP